MTSSVSAFDVRAFEATGRTMKFGLIDRLYFFLHPNVPPTQEDWVAGMVDLEKAFASGLRGVLVYTYGGGPNPTQRKALVEMFSRQAVKVTMVVVTPSAVVRSIVTAVNFFLSTGIKPFSPAKLDEAFAYVGASAEEQGVVRQLIARSTSWGAETRA